MANEDKPAALTGLAAIHRGRDRLAAKVKTLERDLGTACKATGGTSPEPTRDCEPESPVAESGGAGAPNSAGVWYLLAGLQAWHALAEATAGQMSSVVTSLQMAVLRSGQAVEAANVAPKGPGHCRPLGAGPAVPPPPPQCSGGGRRFRRGGWAKLPWPGLAELCWRGGGA